MIVEVELAECIYFYNLEIKLEKKAADGEVLEIPKTFKIKKNTLKKANNR